MSFAAPSYLPWLLLAPAALVLAALLRARWRRAAARWVDPVLWPRLMPHHRPARVVLGISALGLAVAGLVVALARPQAGAADEAVAVTGGDVVFALDSSLSMAAGDVAPSRFALAKLTLRRLLEELPDQRVALVQWEAEAQVLSPLTTDRGLVRVLADGIHPASLDRPGSDLGVALDTALDLLGDGGSIVLLTDGEDHGGSLGTGLDSRLAALTAAGVHVEAIGVGTPEGSRIVLDGGRFKRDDRGQPVVTRLDQEALEALARRTGGLYLHLVRADQDLGVLLGRLRMPAAGAGVGRQPVERFAWPLALAVAALAAHLLLLGGGG
ncbi:MAG: VWA domain-containing protein, partial [Acidobacteria bacterium]|nr:VWA domain-containing protein [Acidobacteriota bacterium]